VVERLAPSSPDPSPKLRGWDKVRMHLHSRTRVSFLNGGSLCALLKSKSNPYELEDSGGSLAKIWSGGLVIHLGHKNQEKEYVQITSQEFMIGVP
ncbi:hypothetical protein BDF14DRAFT_1683511, partial [Spinellus fusiger]